jgi:hypothetical protein
MSVPNETFTVANEAIVIRDWLKLWADKRGGTVKILISIAHLWEEIYSVQFQDQARILICYNGEIARGGFNQANTLHRVDRQWKVVVLRGTQGFKNLAAEGVGQTGTPGSIDPFYDDVETIRDLIRVLDETITNEPPVDFKSISALPLVGNVGQAGNIFLAAYSIEFSTAQDLQAITDLNPN